MASAAVRPSRRAMASTICTCSSDEWPAECALCCISAISDDTFRYSDHPDYVAAFRAGLDTLAALPCDILMTPHPGGSDLWPRLRGEAPLVDTNACRAYADQGREGLATRLDKERKGTAP